MTPDSKSPAITLRRMLAGYQVSQAIHVAATLGIADLLAGASLTSDELAAVTGTHPPTLYRLLRALASVEVLRELEGRRFELAALGEPLRTNVPGSLAGAAAYAARPYRMQAWGALLHSVRTGENAFEHVHGTDIWTYRAAHPEESAIYDRAMTSVSRGADAALLAAFDFDCFRAVVDVGGGSGALMAAILTAHPDVRGVLFDRPGVASGAAALLDEAGVSDRCQIVAGSFFESVPLGADGYVLRSVIHNWDDAQCVRILTLIRDALAEGGKLLVVESMVARPNEGRDGKFSDLNMLVTLGGRERTVDEVAALLQAAGLRLTRVIPAGMQSIAEAVHA